MFCVDFEGCCSAKILTGFGQESAADYEYRPEKHKVTESHMERSLREHIDDCREGGNAVIVVTYTQNQEIAHTLFKKYGFIVSEPMMKNKHFENELRLAYLPLHNYQMPDVVGRVVQARDRYGRFVKSNPFKNK